MAAPPQRVVRAGFDGGDDLTFEAVLVDESRAIRCDQYAKRRPEQNLLMRSTKPGRSSPCRRGQFQEGALVHGSRPRELVRPLCRTGGEARMRDNTWYWGRRGGSWWQDYRRFTLNPK